MMGLKNIGAIVACKGIKVFSSSLLLPGFALKNHTFHRKILSERHLLQGVFCLGRYMCIGGKTSWDALRIFDVLITFT